MKLTNEQIQTIKEELKFIINVMKGQELLPHHKKRLTRIRNVLKALEPKDRWVLMKLRLGKPDEVVKTFNAPPTEKTLKEFPRKMISALLVRGDYMVRRTVFVVNKE